tara:strand:- start:96 stop:653 length:558 start_codon:yes stop_codon:yes gene_type:complete
MSNLKELTKEQHGNAERQAFVTVLMSGNINPDFYATYLFNQHKKYDVLEEMASTAGLLDDLPGIRRATNIEEDFLDLWTDDILPIIVDSTEEYISHMKTIEHDTTSIMAHLYVLHMGDLYGGQMISKRAPGEGRMYQFEGDTTVLKDTIRAKTTDDMADEAKYVFESATNLFKELMELDIEHYLE